jgi:hypothetical protein
MTKLTKFEKTNLTILEKTALELIIGGCLDFPDRDLLLKEMESGSEIYCFADVRMISKACKITENAAKGVLGSLVKKKLAFIVDDYEYINPTPKGILLIKH